LETPRRKNRPNNGGMMFTPMKQVESLVQDSMDYNASPGKKGGCVGSASTFRSVADPEIIKTFTKEELSKQEVCMEFDRFESGYADKLLFQHRTYQTPIEADCIKDPANRNFGIDHTKCAKIFGNLNQIRLAHTGGIVLMTEQTTSSGRKERCLREKSEPKTAEEAAEFDNIIREDDLLDDADKRVVCFGVRSCMSLTTRIKNARLGAPVGRVGPLLNLGALTLSWIQDGGLDQYSTYCCNIVTAKQTLRSELENQAALKQGMLSAFLSLGKTIKGGKRQMLDDLLDLPRRQLQRYPLLLSQVLKHTPPTDPDYGPLTEALKACEAVCHETNSKINQTDGAKLVQIHSKLDFSHANKWQKIDVLDHELVSATTATNMKDEKPIHLYLFKTLLLITKDSKHVPGKEQVSGIPIFMQNLGLQKPMFNAGQTPTDDFREQSKAMLQISNDDPLLTSKHSTRTGFTRGNGSGKGGKTYLVKFKDNATRELWHDLLIGEQQESIMMPTSFV
jgi:hypothetical protein